MFYFYLAALRSQLQHCSMWTQWPWGMWDLSFVTHVPVLEGGFLTTGPQGKSLQLYISKDESESCSVVSNSL